MIEFGRFKNVQLHVYITIHESYHDNVHVNTIRVINRHIIYMRKFRGTDTVHKSQ